MTWFSQAGQDKWVVDQLGEGLGFFVDVGAYDGIEHSNTYTLETEYGWNGVCVEPDPVPFTKLCQTRHAITSDLAISSTTGLVVVQPSGLTRSARSLTWLLDRVGPQDRIIDYLSIDTEGHELAVLTGIDFDRWHIRLITIEHNLYLNGPWLKEQIDVILRVNDFICDVEDVEAPGYGPYESWYVHA